MTRFLSSALLMAAVAVLLTLPACSTMHKSQETCAACDGQGRAKCSASACQACGGKGCEKCAQAACKACGGKGCAKCKPS